MMTTNEKSKFRVIDNPSVTETYANKLVGCMFDGGAMTLTLGVARVITNRIDDIPKEPPEVYVTTRLAISPAGAVELANSLNQMLGAIASRPNPQKAFSIQTNGSHAH